MGEFGSHQFETKTNSNDSLSFSDITYSAINDITRKNNDDDQSVTSKDGITKKSGSEMGDWGRIIAGNGWTSQDKNEVSEPGQKKSTIKDNDGKFLVVTSPYFVDNVLSGLGIGAQAKHPPKPGDKPDETSSGTSASKEFKKYADKFQKELLNNAALTVLQIAEQANTNLKVQVNIEALGSNFPRVRRDAEKELIKIGSAARPALQKLLDGNEPDLKHRAKNILETIQYNEDEPKRREYDELRQNAQAFLSKLGIRVLGKWDEEYQNVIDQPPPDWLKLSKDDKLAFEKLISKTDTILADKRFKQIAETSRTDDMFQSLMFLQRLAENSRMTFAMVLSYSKDPADHQKAIGVMTDHLKRNKTLPMLELIDMSGLAVDVKAHKNPEFIKAYKAAGGDVRFLDTTDDGPGQPVPNRRQQIPGGAPNGGDGGGGGEAPPRDRNQPAPPPSIQ